MAGPVTAWPISGMSLRGENAEIVYRAFHTMSNSAEFKGSLVAVFETAILEAAEKRKINTKEE